MPVLFVLPDLTRENRMPTCVYRFATQPKSKNLTLLRMPLRPAKNKLILNNPAKFPVVPHLPKQGIKAGAKLKRYAAPKSRYNNGVSAPPLPDFKNIGLSGNAVLNANNLKHRPNNRRAKRLAAHG